jgi:hypothetical protein
MFAGKARSLHLRGTPEKCFTRVDFGFTCKHETGLERLGREIRSNAFQFCLYSVESPARNRSHRTFNEDIYSVRPIKMANNLSQYSNGLAY